MIDYIAKTFEKTMLLFRIYVLSYSKVRLNYITNEILFNNRFECQDTNCLTFAQLNSSIGNACYVIWLDYLESFRPFSTVLSKRQYLTEKRSRKSRKSIILRFDFEREAGLTTLEIRLQEFIGSLTNPKLRPVPARSTENVHN